MNQSDLILKALEVNAPRELTEQQIADSTGLSRSAVTNELRHLVPRRVAKEVDGRTVRFRRHPANYDDLDVAA